MQLFSHGLYGVAPTEELLNDGYDTISEMLCAMEETWAEFVITEDFIDFNEGAHFDLHRP